MHQLFRNIRFYVLCFSVFLSFGMYMWVISTISIEGLAKLTLVRVYAITAITYLYFALLVGPLSKLFPKFPFLGKYLKARRAIGVSAFYFGSLHAFFAFFDIIGGFEGYFALDIRYRIAVFCGQIALFILTLMAVTSFDWAIRRLTFKRWKFLHRFVYLAALLIIIHAILVGKDFQTLNTKSLIYLVALIVLLILEIAAFVKMRRLSK